MSKVEMSDVKGYVPLSDSQKATMNAIKEAESNFISLLEKAREEGANPRSIAVAITNAETSAMWASKAVTKP